METVGVVLLIVCTLSLLLSGGAVLWVALFSAPASLRKEVDGVRVLADGCRRSFEQMEANFLAHRAEMNGIAEGVEGLLQTVERKRKQTTVAAQRLKVVEEPTAPQTRDDLLAPFRQKIYGGG